MLGKKVSAVCRSTHNNNCLLKQHLSNPPGVFFRLPVRRVKALTYFLINKSSAFVKEANLFFEEREIVQAAYVDLNESSILCCSHGD